MIAQQLLQQLGLGLPLGGDSLEFTQVGRVFGLARTVAGGRTGRVDLCHVGDQLRGQLKCLDGM